jgi:hypothetical protein
VLSALAVAFAAAFVLAPRTLAASARGGGFASQRTLIDALRTAFVGYWGSGDRGYSPALARIVDYWFRYHVAKAVFAALLLAVFVALGLRLFRVLVRQDGVRSGLRVLLASAAALVTLLALASVALVMANIQGAAAPFASLLSMLPVGARDRPLTATVGQVKRQLAGYPSTRTSPALDGMVNDYARYHAVLVVLAAIAVAVMIGICVALWKRFAKTDTADKRTRRVLASFGTVAALTTPALLVLAAANLSTATNPAPGLLAFFNGAW